MLLFCFAFFLFYLVTPVLSFGLIYKSKQNKKKYDMLIQKGRDKFMIISNISRLMKEKKITIRGLCTSSKVAHATIVRARGPLIAECRLSTLVAIAAALGVTTKDLYTEEPDTKKGSSKEPPGASFIEL